ncbi:MAG: murein biosynthesis integral membrane protein MurJ [Puniceicoccales bacterium]|jgi:putative peptidoglycan lipid II flippase|nr:murein biosynthesis integral membrane protein MurJ [Puniceicoccales bacterium]
MSKRTHYKNMVLTASGTMGSRILGLVRDQLIAASFGTYGVGAALILAFQIPNLFRRLLGEGALTAALVPVMSDEHRKGGKEKAFHFLNIVITRASLLMLAITLLAMFISWIISLYPALEDRYQQAAYFTVICMPYMPLICTAALFTAGLNLLGRFGITSLSAVWLNLSMILAIVVAKFCFAQDGAQLAVWACVGMLAGGALQLGIPMLALWREGWRPRLTLEASESWTQLKYIFIPAVTGAGIQQINFFISRFLAFNVDSSALSVYYFANRIVELPIGVFAITISTVIFPAMTMQAAHGDKREMGSTFAHGMRLIFAINIPAAVGLIVLAHPIVAILFQHGEFSASDTAITLPVLGIFALAMPLYGVISLAGRGLNAVKDTRTQSRVALWVFLLNLVLSPLFAWWWKAPGLAAANLVSAILQCVLLLRTLKRRDAAFFQESLFKPLMQCIGAAVGMGIFTAGGWYLCQHWLTVPPGWLHNFLEAIPWQVLHSAHFHQIIGGILALVIIISGSVVLYFFLLGRMHYPEYDFLMKKLLGRFRRNKQLDA